MNRLALIWLLLLPLFWGSCRSDFETVPSSGRLEFSKDTVYLDTIFSDIGSSTYNLKVYNRSREDISIPQIRLGLGEDSHYRLNVDGISGKQFKDIEIPARDSIYIFVETTLDIEDLGETQFLYTDRLEFDAGEYLQQVPLITLVKDAVFLYPRKYDDGNIETIPLGEDENGDVVKVQGFFLKEQQLQFTKEKPYVIYGFAIVPENRKLHIEAGARLHFHSNSGMIISEGASLQALGTYSEDRKLLENEIIFEGSRLEPRFSEIPGQWGSLWFRQGSTNNLLDHVTIKNAGIGIWAEGNTASQKPDVLIRNTQIYNSSLSGLLARNAHISAENLVIANSAQASLQISQGGNYSFRHSTFANYWNLGLRQYPAVLIENYFPAEAGVYSADLTKADFFNCIIYGNKEQELLLFQDEIAEFSFSFRDCLIKFQDPDNRFGDSPFFDFTDSNYYQNILLNKDPEFAHPLKNDLQLTENSPARDIGNTPTAENVPFDLRNNSRTQSPDLGAYEWIPLNE